jgi:hypothetical protein
MTATPTAEPQSSTADAPEPEDGRGSLLRSELHRIVSRRMIQVLVGLAALGFLAVAAISFTQFSEPTPELFAQAEADRAEVVEESQGFYEECLESPDIPEGDAELYCGSPPSTEDIPLDQFLPKAPFTVDNIANGALAVAFSTAALAFVIGATYAGAEWSSRSIVALLFWEPRRLKVMGTKLAVITAVAAVLAVVAQAAWLGIGALLAATRGPGLDDASAGFWGNLLAQQGRSVLLVVLTALLGFGLANLTRNTGAALGLAFVYFAVVENAVRVVRQEWSPYLFGESAGALVTEGGISVFIYDFSASPDGGFSEGREIMVSNLQGGVTLLVYTAIVVIVGTVLFQRRDLH